MPSSSIINYIREATQIDFPKGASNWRFRRERVQFVTFSKITVRRLLSCTNLRCYSLANFLKGRLVGFFLWFFNISFNFILTVMVINNEEWGYRGLFKQKKKIMEEILCIDLSKTQNKGKSTWNIYFHIQKIKHENKKNSEK